MKFSVIMPVLLSDYPFCADKRDKRFIFSVQSFINQKHRDSELIIISDGCDIAENIYYNYFRDNQRIKFEKIDKGVYFAGATRQRGIEMANGDLILYLDSDDFIGENHLNIIDKNFDIENYDWCFYNDYVFRDYKLKKNRFLKRIVTVDGKLRIGTSSFCHKRELQINWTSGYGHDHEVVKQLKELGKYQRLNKMSEYFICHLPECECFNIENPEYLCQC